MSTICAACAEFIVSPAITEPHALMVRQNEHRQLPNGDVANPYHCLECSSAWLVKRIDAPDLGLRRIPKNAGVHYRAAGLQRPHQVRFLPSDAVSIS